MDDRVENGCRSGGMIILYGAHLYLSLQILALGRHLFDFKVCIFVLLKPTWVAMLWKDCRPCKC